MIERFARLPIENPKQITVSVIIFSLLISPYIFQVEFATDVRLIDQCQKARSQAKKRPARINKKYSPIVEGFFRCPLAGLDKDIQTQRTGSAKVIR